MQAEVCRRVADHSGIERRVFRTMALCDGRRRDLQLCLPLRSGVSPLGCTWRRIIFAESSLVEQFDGGSFPACSCMGPSRDSV